MAEQRADFVFMSHGWGGGVALATLLLTLLIGVGATFSDVPSDRPGWKLFLVVSAIGATTLAINALLIGGWIGAAVLERRSRH